MLVVSRMADQRAPHIKSGGGGVSSSFTCLALLHYKTQRLCFLIPDCLNMVSLTQEAFFNTKLQRVGRKRKKIVTVVILDGNKKSGHSGEKTSNLAWKK